MHSFSMMVVLLSCLTTVATAFNLPQFKVTPQNPKVIYFSGAGIYFWWQLGVAKYMKENCEPEFFTSTRVIGASAGSITSTMLLTGADLDRLPELALEEALKRDLFSRPTGLAGVWGDLVQAWLYRAIPDTVKAKNLRNLEVAVTPNFGTPKLVKGFKTKDDIIEAILASCHIPLFLNGKLYRDYRGERVIDGSFWYFVTKNRFTGLPLPAGVDKADIFWIDYCDDEDFMLSISGNFLELANPEGVYDMIDSGYNHMKREHFYGRLPYTKRDKPTFVGVPMQEAVSVSLQQVISNWNTAQLYNSSAKYASYAKDSIMHAATGALSKITPSSSSGKTKQASPKSPIAAPRSAVAAARPSTSPASAVDSRKIRSTAMASSVVEPSTDLGPRSAFYTTAASAWNTISTAGGGKPIAVNTLALEAAAAALTATAAAVTEGTKKPSKVKPKTKSSPAESPESYSQSLVNAASGALSTISVNARKVSAMRSTPAPRVATATSMTSDFSDVRSIVVDAMKDSVEKVDSVVSILKKPARQPSASELFASVSTSARNKFGKPKSPQQLKKLKESERKVELYLVSSFDIVKRGFSSATSSILTRLPKRGGE